MRIATVDRLHTILGDEEAAQVIRLARRVQKLEGKWLIEVERFYRELARITARRLLDAGGRVPSLGDIDFEELFTEFWYDVQIQAFKSVDKPVTIPKRLTKKKRTLKDLIAERAAWRKGKRKPNAPKGYAKSMKDEYLKGIHKYWKKHADDFLEGKVYNQDEALKKLTEDLDMGVPQAKTIIRTETTRHYNEVRKEFYDGVPDVTHYLFICIRDHRTTDWCKTRDGLVYSKKSKFLPREMPPIHWNCRSELLPLDPDNPKHKLLIDDKGQSRDNHTPTPLPRGFNTR